MVVFHSGKKAKFLLILICWLEFASEADFGCVPIVRAAQLHEIQRELTLEGAKAISRSAHFQSFNLSILPSLPKDPRGTKLVSLKFAMPVSPSIGPSVDLSVS